MNDELMYKFVVMILIISAVFIVGSIVAIYVGPVFAVALLVDQVMRHNYNTKLEKVKTGKELFAGPQLIDFDARVYNDKPTIIWNVNLPGHSHMDIYRLEGQSYSSPEEVERYGICIHSITGGLESNSDDILTDDEAPRGTLFYVAIITGQIIEKKPLDYGFFNFTREVQYSERKHNIRTCSNICRVRNIEEDTRPVALADDRDEATKMADEILQDIVDRKDFNTQLDEAIKRINGSNSLSEEEKKEAIERLETRVGAG